MKICALSDLHGYLPSLNLPEADVYTISGDIVPLNIQGRVLSSISWYLLEFLPWAEKLPCECVILIAGNHDFFFQRINRFTDSFFPGGSELLTYQKTSKVVYLEDEEFVYKGVHFYGTPWIPDLQNWAFYKNSSGLKEVFGKIPEGIDILLTHTPPKVGRAGKVLQFSSFNFGADYGCQELADAIAEKKPKYVLCGHVHSGDHAEFITKEGVKVINVSTKNEDYLPVFIPTVIEI